MNKTLEGTSELALLASSLPTQARIGLVLMAADLALEQLKSSDSCSVARTAFELIRRWHDGERFRPDQFEEAMHDERDQGLDLCAQNAESEQALSALLVLASAVLYTAFHAYRAVGECPSPLVSEVDEDELDELEKQLRALGPAAINAVMSAGKFLQRHPDASFAQLKSGTTQSR
jgi:Immunity protein Imm6